MCSTAFSTRVSVSSLPPRSVKASCKRSTSVGKIVAPQASRDDALLMGLELAQAQSWLTKRAEDLPSADREFIGESLRHDALERRQRQRMQQRTRQMGALAGVLILGIGARFALSSRAYLEALPVIWVEVIGPKALTADAERALKPRLQGMRPLPHD